MNMEKLYKYLEWMFYRRLCPQPDKPILKWMVGENRGMKITGWLYNYTGRIAGYFHAKTCPRCKEKRGNIC